VTHSDVRELIAAYAVGALEGEDSGLVQDHLGECGFCANLAREAAEVAHYLPYAAPAQRVPAGSLERLMASVADANRAPEPAAAPALSVFGARRRWLERLLDQIKTPVFAPAITAVVLLLGLGGWNMLLMGELKEERRQMSALQGRLAQQTHLMVMVTSGSTVTKPLQGTPLAPSAEVRLVMDGETNSAMLMATRLPPPPAGRIYQVWLGRQGARMPAGRLVVDADGDGECNLLLDASVHSYDSAWITLEPAEGGPLPNSPGVAKGFL
jgi:hypothetical protein